MNAAVRHNIMVDVSTALGGAVTVTCSCGNLRHRIASLPLTLARLNTIAREHKAAHR